VVLRGNDQDREAIVSFFASHLSQLPERSAGVSALMNQWNQDTIRAAAVEALFGEFSSIFLQNPTLFRLSGHPLRVTLVSAVKASGAEDSSQHEDDLLAVATSVTSQVVLLSGACRKSRSKQLTTLFCSSLPILRLTRASRCLPLTVTRQVRQWAPRDLARAPHQQDLAEARCSNRLAPCLRALWTRRNRW
jgi:hypothetical protein